MQSGKEGNDMSNMHAVTGAFGFSGSRIARQLLEKDREVITLTNSSDRDNKFEGAIKAFPLCFDDPARLEESLKGVSVLYNTYWIRFNTPVDDHTLAYHNTLKLFAAAKRAGVERIVHISITNPSTDSSLDYFREKAQVEERLKELGITYAILRPAVIFGENSILINNIAWSLRKLPVFGYFGRGEYEIQPVHVEDLARLAVQAGESRKNSIINAVGPEKFKYKDLVRTIAEVIGKKPLILPAPEFAGYLAGLLIGKMVGDVMMTRDELRALTAGLLSVDSEPTGRIRLTEWMKDNAETLGIEYAKSLR